MPAPVSIPSRWTGTSNIGAGGRIILFQSPETAIENACRLIDDGHDVFGIGTGALTDSIEREQIARIYAMWTKAKSSFGG
jgi:hypothetical protein